MTRIYFSSGIIERHQKALSECKVPNGLVSYWFIKLHEGTDLFTDSNFNSVMIDSGVYTFLKNPSILKKHFGTSDPKKAVHIYTKGYYEWLLANQERYEYAVEIDLYPVLGEEFIRELHEEFFFPFQKETGKEIIFTLHQQGIKDWNYYINHPEINYLAIGSSVTMSNSDYCYWVGKCLKLNKKTHGFAITQLNRLINIPFFSVDSSVDGESYTLIKKENSIERIKIKNLYDSLNKSEFRTFKHETRVLADNIQTLTVDDNNKLIWSDLTGVIKHTVNKPMVRIKLEGGKTLECTNDHSLITMDSDGKLIETKPTDLKIGDFLLSNKSILLNNHKKITETLTIQKSKSHKPNLIDLDIEITDKLLQFLGLWIGDGHSMKDGTIGVSKWHHKECRELIEEILGSFDSKISVSDNKIDCRVSNIKLKRIFDELGFIGNSLTKKIPSFIYSLSKEQISQFLKGYFSADGSCNSLSISTSSEDLKNDLIELLTIFEIYPSVTFYDEKEVLIRGKKSFKNKSWCISIKDTISRINFESSIGFLQDYKNKKLKEDINCLKDKKQLGSKKLTIPTNLSLGEVVNYPDGRKVNKKSITGKRVNRFCNSDNFNEKIINSDLLFLQIKGIEIISENKDIEVYDLSVDKFERFFANGILVHNTTWMSSDKYGEHFIFDKELVKLKRVYPKEQKDLLNYYLKMSYNAPFEEFTKRYLNDARLYNAIFVFKEIEEFVTELWKERGIDYDQEKFITREKQIKAKERKKAKRTRIER